MSSYFSSWFPSKGSADETTTSTPPKPSRPKNDAPTIHPTGPVSDSLPLMRSHEISIDRALVFALGAASGVAAILFWRRWGMRLRTAEWVTPNTLVRRQRIRGVVTSVGDADDFRLYHTPGFGWRWPFKIRHVPTKRKDLKNQTIHVRVAGIDAPECPHGALPGQPHGKESLAWLKNRIHRKTIYCQLICKDRYGRIIGIPLVPRPFQPLFLCKYFGSPLPLEMLRAGTAMVYRESGGEYGPWGREGLMRIEEEARNARRGMWKDGANIETPGEYKRRYAAAFGSPESKGDVTESDNGEDDEGDRKRGLLSKLSKLLK